MENNNRVVVSSSSFTLDLFGPKESSSSTGLFGSFFGPPPSKAIRKDSSYAGSAGSLRKQDLGIQTGNAKYGTSGNITQKGSAKANQDIISNYENHIVDSCYFSSSIYYGGQEIYYSNGQNMGSQQIFRRKDFSNGNNLHDASRGDWWQGSLYY